MPTSTLAAVAACLLAATPLFAQSSERDPRRVEIDARLAKELSAFARRAALQKANTLAREVATLVVQHYDADNSSARGLLGERKVRGRWQEQPDKKLVGDAVDPRRRQELETAWQTLRATAGALHRDLGLALAREGAPADRSRREFELALHYLPGDRECHRALGHHEFEGYHGTADDVAFCQRMRAILAAAAEIAARDYDVRPVDESAMPEEIRVTGIPLFGAKSQHYTYWSSESYDAAANCAAWSERSHALLTWLLGGDAHLVRGDAWRWHLVLRTEEERDILLQRSPSTLGPFTFEQARLFVGIGFALQTGGRAAATWEPSNVDADYSVANVTKRHFLDQRNDGLGEGLTHATTWLLCRTTSTYFADIPKTAAGSGKPIARDPIAWFERLQQEIAEGRDMPLAVVPRERPDSFRDSTRLKSWSFMLWMLARHPDRWLPLIEKVSAPRLTPELVDAAFLEVFGVPVGEVEADWRRWAKGGSALGRASGVPEAK